MQMVLNTYFIFLIFKIFIYIYIYYYFIFRSQYKRSAFLRCEEEKEQFLYHLLTLNAVDYFCFTNNYPTTKLPYRVIIFPSRKASAATTSANSWIAISGTLCETNPVPIPKGALEFVFHVCSYALIIH